MRACIRVNSLGLCLHARAQFLIQGWVLNYLQAALPSLQKYTYLAELADRRFGAQKCVNYVFGLYEQVSRRLPFPGSEVPLSSKNPT